MWLPDKEIKAIVQISHGITEHILRYEEFARYLTEHNIAVVGNDHIGHGKSLTSNNSAMYFVPLGSWDFVIKDMIYLHQLAKEELGIKPYFVLGFSLGSFLVRTVLIDYPNEFNKVILLGTGYVSHFEAKFAQIMTNREAKKYGEVNPLN